MKIKLNSENLKKYLEILRTIQRYESLISKNQAWEERQLLLVCDPSKIEVEVEKESEPYTFLVDHKINDLSVDNSLRQLCWSHVDGIQEERDELKKKGISEENHPVFGIICLNDIYNDQLNLIKK